MKSKKKLKTVCLSLLSLSVFLLVGCGSNKKQAGDPRNSPNFSQQQEALEAFKLANAKFDDEDYAGAAAAYDKIMLDKPVSTLDGLVIFNSGFAHQMAGDCRTAVSRFRKVVRFTQKRKAEPLTLRAKLKLSDAYSCLGLSNRSLVLLSEIFKQRRRLAPSIGLAEVPAKLAAGYSRLGNRKMADRYFKIADQGLRILENTKLDTKEQNEMLSRTLFTMGDTSQVKFDAKNHKGYFRTLKTLQKYLLRSVSFQVKPWSDKAASQVLAAYEHTWKMVDAVKAPENLNKTRQSRYLKVQRGKILQTALESLQDLKKLKLPTDNATEVKDLFSSLSRTQLKMRNYLVAEAPGSELTQEAKYLQGAKREGRVKSGKTVLEKKREKNKK